MRTQLNPSNNFAFATYNIQRKGWPGIVAGIAAAGRFNNLQQAPVSQTNNQVWECNLPNKDAKVGKHHLPTTLLFTFHNDFPFMASVYLRVNMHGSVLCMHLKDLMSESFTNAHLSTLLQVSMDIEKAANRSIRQLETMAAHTYEDSEACYEALATVLNSHLNPLVLKMAELQKNLRSEITRQGAMYGYSDLTVLQLAIAALRIFKIPAEELAYPLSAKQYRFGQAVHKYLLAQYEQPYQLFSMVA